MKMEFMNQ